MSDQPGGAAVEVRDGRFFIQGTEITEAEALTYGWTPDRGEVGHDDRNLPNPPGDDGSGDLPPSEAPAGGDGPPSVEDRLRAGYKAGQGERRKVIEIAPARYHDLAGQFEPIDWDLRRKLIRQAGKRGEAGHEADLRINSQLMAKACISMLFRPAAGRDYEQLHTQVERFRGGPPVRFDDRLAQVLGIELIGGESEGDICRLIFGDAGVFEAHYMILNGWSLQAFDDDDDEEEDEGGDRPT